MRTGLEAGRNAAVIALAVVPQAHVEEPRDVELERRYPKEPATTEFRDALRLVR